jgi:hypothetical protein
MIQIAGEEASFGRLGTFVLILLPGRPSELLLGWTAHLRPGDLTRRRQH